MVGRGTRKGERFTDKDHFTVFDCFDGTLLAYFKNSTGITAEEPAPPTRTIEDIVKSIWDNRDREYNVGCLVKRLQRIDKAMAGDARDDFKVFVPDGDLARFARGLPGSLRTDFVGAMKLLQDKGFQVLLVGYKRPQRTFIKAYEHPDEVSSVMVLRDVAGREYKPEDYLVAFERFVRENPEHIEAVRILLERPRDWSATALKELRDKLRTNPLRFTEENLQRAHAIQYRKPLADIISMVKHAAKEEAPLLTAAERVDQAFRKIMAGQTFTPEQTKWLDRIRDHLRQNLSIERDDFELIPVFADAGGWGAIRRVFGDTKLDALIHDLNEAVAA
jgi:type I restriction enzyme R subunit